MKDTLVRLLGACLALIACCQNGAASESSFYSQCHKLLPVADEFAHECQNRARPFSREFYPGGGSRGEIESYRAFFKTLDAPSNFVLGCVLDFKNKINFVGLYYSALPLDMAGFADYPIAFIDPGDNVGLQIDGVRHTLVAVRQFVTDVIPPRLTGRPKNCDDPHIEANEGSSATSLMHVRKIDEERMEFCNGSACRISRYSEFGGRHEAPVIFEFNDLFLIDANGILLLREDYFRGACAWKQDASSVYNVLHEMCPKTN